MFVTKISACQLLSHLLGTANLAPVGASLVPQLIAATSSPPWSMPSMLKSHSAEEG